MVRRLPHREGSVLSRPAPSRRKTPDPGRVFVSWTHPVTGRRRLFAEPLEARADELLADCRVYLERGVDFDTDADREAAIASSRIEP